jgi:hypothetical protein
VELDPKSHDDDDRAKHHDHTDGPGIAGVGLAKIEPADPTGWAQSQQPGE